MGIKTMITQASTKSHPSLTAGLNPHLESISGVSASPPIIPQSAENGEKNHSGIEIDLNIDSGSRRGKERGGCSISPNNSIAISPFCDEWQTLPTKKPGRWHIIHQPSGVELALRVCQGDRDKLLAELPYLDWPPPRTNAERIRYGRELLKLADAIVGGEW